MAQNNNPFSEAAKQFLNAQYPSEQLDSAWKQSQKNIEAATESAQIISESVQNAARRNAEIFQANAEGALDLFKQVVASKDPKESAAKQADFAKKTFEKNLADARSVSEEFFQASSKAFELLGKQVTENINEATKQATDVAKKAATNAA